MKNEKKIKYYTSRDARENFSKLINEVAYGHYEIILTRRDKPIAKINYIKEECKND